MALRKHPPVKPEPIDEAARKTGALIRDLQERLTGGGESRPGGLMRELQSRVQQGDEKAGLLIRELQNLRRATGQTATMPEVASSQETASEETEEDLERQMVDYFERSANPAAGTGAPGDLRSRVVDEVVDRILGAWNRDGDSVSLEAEVFERLVRRVLERIQPDAKNLRG